MACVYDPAAAHYTWAIATGSGRGITDPINLSLRLVLAKIERLAANHDSRPAWVRLIDCNDERLEGRYMETRRRHFRQGLPDRGWEPASSAKWFLPCAAALIW